MRSRSLVLAATLLAAAPASGQAYYSSRPLFLADPAVTTTSAIDFESFLPGTNLTGSTISGVTLNAPASGPLTVILGSTGVRFPMSPSSGLNVLSPGGSDPSLEDDDLEILFGTPVRAAGLDVVFDAPDGASFVGVTFFDTGGGTVCSNGFIPAPSGAPGYQFVGCTNSAATIARIVFNEFDGSASDDNVAYDSIVFSPAAAAPNVVPEPATVGLVALGLLALPAARRTRRR